MAYLSLNNAMSRVVANFQANPERFWNERDIHWSLFYCLKLGQVSEETYPTELIRAEFPTLKVFDEARGHYDLVIINAESYNKPEVLNMNAQASWNDYLPLIELDVAIEIKLWLNRLQPEAMKEGVNWDIQKLTDTPNKVKDAYLLNFVQLDFKRDIYEAYYQQLRDYLLEQKKQFPKLNILCVPSVAQMQNSTDNWLEYS
ncbi:hypothetical protein ACFLUB_02080 [Chloroflexota bacterium]